MLIAYDTILKSKQANNLKKKRKYTIDHNILGFSVFPQSVFPFATRAWSATQFYIEYPLDFKPKSKIFWALIYQPWREKSWTFVNKFFIGAYTTSWGAWPQFYWLEKWDFYCDVVLKSKKIQIAQIFKLSFPSLENHKTEKNSFWIHSKFSLGSWTALDITNSKAIFLMVDK